MRNLQESEAHVDHSDAIFTQEDGLTLPFS